MVNSAFSVVKRTCLTSVKNRVVAHNPLPPLDKTAFAGLGGTSSGYNDNTAGILKEGVDSLFYSTTLLTTRCLHGLSRAGRHGSDSGHAAPAGRHAGRSTYMSSSCWSWSWLFVPAAATFLCPKFAEYCHFESLGLRITPLRPNLVNEKLLEQQTKISEVGEDELDMAEDQNEHPLRWTITPQVNNLILSHWEFDSEEQKQRFLQQDLTGLACLAFPFALEDRIELIARLFSIVYLLGELVGDLDVEDAEECLDSLQEAVKGYWKPDPDQAPVFEHMTIRLLTILSTRHGSTLSKHLTFYSLRIVQRGRRARRLDEVQTFKDSFLAAGLELPLHRFATGIVHLMKSLKHQRWSSKNFLLDFDERATTKTLHKYHQLLTTMMSLVRRQS
ncbi:uncharacterized protein MYCFIDRAFT_171353 [Pseudocercospora fijiensis CIRAD86]|uniref:Uncharacterized protein n=1 Tax=Pseudocercospora fijiensis (strain CIRAD86) TaxID=383855 RepID=M3ALF8_PSEFD|nr:uncharacterized protein MYCFIDRAFT_171353 [Pseudocercospora fijiensis CIRAD86]EME85426.1 hypothetical protein MYCFIDRAFT_171353 [Pseudocercospora fijiensis CIRAD86]